MNDFSERLNRHVDDQTPEQLPPFGEVVARRDQRRRRRRAVAASGAAVVAVAAIAIGTQLAGPDSAPDSSGPTTTSPSPTETGRPEPTYEWNNQPSPVVLRLDDRDVELDPYTYCWTGPAGSDGVAAGACADGIPGKLADLGDVGGPEVVDFWFGVPGWEFTATFTELGTDCPRSFSAAAVPTGSHMFRLAPAGPAGRYVVELFGRGDDSADGPGGDVVTTFIWTTPVDGPVEPPTAFISVVSDDEGSPTGLIAYGGYELGLSDLATTPLEASAEVTVTATNGRSMTLEGHREEAAESPGDCYQAGTVYFSGNDAQAQQVTELGPAPFTYEVLLTLDGEEYVGTAVWPRDENPDESPNTALTFEPPLPAYAGE